MDESLEMQPPITLAQSDAWLAECMRSEALSGKSIAVPPALTKPSQALKTTINAIKAEKVQKFRLKPDGDSTYAYPPHFRFHPSVMALKVTPGSADRAVLIIDTLMKACVARGLDVSVADRYMRVSYYGHAVQVRISERVEKIVGSVSGLSDYDRMADRHIRYRATGEFLIAVIRMNRERKTVDKNGLRIEDQLDAVLANIYRGIAEQWAWSDNIKSRDEALENEWQAHRADVAKRDAAAADAAAIETAQQKQKLDLVAEATAWQQSRTIVSYVEHLTSEGAKCGGSMTAELKEWIDQATAIAERMDPTNVRIEKKGGRR